MPNKQTKVSTSTPPKTFLNKYQKYLMILGIVIFIVIIIQIAWSYFYKGTIEISTNQNYTNIYICSTLDNIESTGQEGSGCYGNPLAQTHVLSTFNETISITPGEYYIVVNKENFIMNSQKIKIELWQTTSIDAYLQPTFVKFSENIVKDISYDSEKNIYYYIEQVNYFDNNQLTKDFAINQLSKDNIQNIYTLKNFSDIKNIFWSPDSTKIVFNATSDNITYEKYYLDINNSTLTKSSIPSDKISWNKNSDKIFYIYQNNTINSENTTDLPSGGIGYAPKTNHGPNHNTLTIANPDGTEWKSIIQLNFDITNPKLILSPDNNSIAMIDTNYKLTILDLDTLEIHPIISNYKIIDGSWSPDSNILLTQIHNNQKPELAQIKKFTTTSGEEFSDRFSQKNNYYLYPLNIYTYITKSQWLDNNHIFAALPTSISEQLPNDTEITDDFLYSINISDTSAIIISKFNNNNYILKGVSKALLNKNSDFILILDNNHSLYALSTNPEKL